MVNNCPPRPTRFWVKIAGPAEVQRMIIAMISPGTKKRSSTRAETRISKTRFMGETLQLREGGEENTRRSSRSMIPPEVVKETAEGLSAARWEIWTRVT